MRDDPNPTCPPAHVLRAFPEDFEDFLDDDEPLRRTLSLGTCTRVALASAREAALERAGFPRGEHEPPGEVLRLLRMPREYQLQVVEARKRLPPEERAALARNRGGPTHRTLSMRGVLRLAREIARDEEMNARRP